MPPPFRALLGVPGALALLLVSAAGAGQAPQHAAGAPPKPTARPSQSPVVQVAASSGGRGCVRRADGTVECWVASYGAYRISGVSHVALARGASWWCGLDTGGKIFCQEGPLRHFAHDASTLQRVTELVGAGEHFCALHDKGVSCWGYNPYGGLGVVINEAVTRPVAIRGLPRIVKLGGGYWHTCAVDEKGGVWCWGRNAEGQLGNGARTLRQPTAVRVNGVSDAFAVSAGLHHSCALRKGGTVVCWGANNVGQLGNGQREEALATVEGLPDVVQLSTEQHQTCALRRDGTVHCWGSHLFLRQIAPKPTRVAGLTDVVEVSLGSGFACARDRKHDVYCWGSTPTNDLSRDLPRRQLAVDVPVRLDLSGPWCACPANSGATALICPPQQMYLAAWCGKR